MGGYELVLYNKRTRRMIIYGVFNFFIAYFVVEREKEVARRTGHYFN